VVGRALAAAVLLTACGTDVTVFPGGDGGQASTTGGSTADGGSGGGPQGGQGGGANGGTSPQGGSGASGGSGHGGFGTGGPGEGGAEPVCKTCSEAISGAPGPLCPEAEVYFAAVVSCACETGCPEVCAPTCAGMDDGPACDSCIGMACAPQLDACFNH
jgi:hypothetical protein